MGIKPDKIDASSLTDAFINREVFSESVTYSGSIPPGGTEFIDTITIDRNFGVFEGYYRRTGNFYAHRADNGTILLDATWPHRVYISLVTTSGNDLQIKVFFDNPTGGSIALSSQTYLYKIYVFDTPFVP